MLNTTLHRDGIHLTTRDDEYVGTIRVSYGDNGGRKYVLHLADRFSVGGIPQDHDWGYSKAAEFAALAAYCQIDGNTI